MHYIRSFDTESLRNGTGTRRRISVLIETYCAVKSADFCAFG